MIAAILLAGMLPALVCGAQTVVSLGFDDGSADQLQARQMLDARGLKGTFYINSAQLASSSWYMTKADVDLILANGHEIAGHTLHHFHLPTLLPAQMKTEICDDRAALTSWGYHPTSFAYPFGEWNSVARQIVKDCGYTAARTTSGERDTIPPADPWAIRAPPSIQVTHSLASIKKHVTDAEDAGGGWVNMIFHHVCDGAGCTQYSVSASNLAAFLDWLKARSGQGTVVKTVAQVMESAQPPAPAPAPALSALSPTGAAVGGGAFTLTALGSGFVSRSVVQWNGSSRPTTFASSTQLRASIGASDIASPATHSVAVHTPGAGASSAISFSVSPQQGAAPPPIIGPGAASNLDGLRVYPNPWRSGQHAGLDVTFDRLTPQSQVRIFTATGQSVRTAGANAGTARWDLTNEAGQRVSSGPYLYLITDDQGRHRRGVVTVVR